MIGGATVKRTKAGDLSGFFLMGNRPRGARILGINRPPRGFSGPALTGLWAGEKRRVKRPLTEILKKSWQNPVIAFSVIVRILLRLKVFKRLPLDSGFASMPFLSPSRKSP